MKADHIEYKGIIKKLLEKTREGRVEWTADVRPNCFRCTIGPPVMNNALAARVARLHEEEPNFSFTIVASGTEDPCPTLIMWDQGGNEIFRVVSNDLPTSPEEEEVSQMIEEIYDLARRQALKIEQKLEWASTLLDRV